MPGRVYVPDCGRRQNRQRRGRLGRTHTPAQSSARRPAHSCITPTANPLFQYPSPQFTPPAAPRNLFARLARSPARPLACSPAMPRASTSVHAAAAAASAVAAPRSRQRAFPAAKALAFREQQHLLTNHDLVLFLRPGDFAAHEWRQLRQQIAAVPPPPPSPSATAQEAASPVNDLRLTYLRPGLVPAVIRDLERQQQLRQSRTAAAAAEGSSSSSSAPPAAIDTSYLADQSHLSGPLAAVTAQTLHPPTLLRVLALLRRFARTPPPNAPPPAPDAPPLERIKVLSSLLERHTAADPHRTAAVAQLPAIEVLHAQLVGLLSAPGARISGVLSARASDLARTLEGFKVGLEEAQQAQAPTADSPPSA